MDLPFGGGPCTAPETGIIGQNPRRGGGRAPPPLRRRGSSPATRRLSAPCCPTAVRSARRHRPHPSDAPCAECRPPVARHECAARFPPACRRAHAGVPVPPVRRHPSLGAARHPFAARFPRARTSAGPPPTVRCAARPVHRRPRPAAVRRTPSRRPPHSPPPCAAVAARPLPSAARFRALRVCAPLLDAPPTTSSGQDMTHAASLPQYFCQSFTPCVRAQAPALAAKPPGDPA